MGKGERLSPKLENLHDRGRRRQLGGLEAVQEKWLSMEHRNLLASSERGSSEGVEVVQG